MERAGTLPHHAAFARTVSQKLRQPIGESQRGRARLRGGDQRDFRLVLRTTFDALGFGKRLRLLTPGVRTEIV